MEPTDELSHYYSMFDEVYSMLLSVQDDDTGMFRAEKTHAGTQDVNIGLYGVEKANMGTQDDNNGPHRVERADIGTHNENTDLYGVEKANMGTQDANTGPHKVERANIGAHNENTDLYGVEKANMETQDDNTGLHSEEIVHTGTQGHNSDLKGEEVAHTRTQEEDTGLYGIGKTNMETQDGNNDLQRIEMAHMETQDDNIVMYGVQKAYIGTQDDNTNLNRMTKDEGETQDDNTGLHGVENVLKITQDDNIGLYRVEDAHVITQDKTIGLYGVEDAHVITQDDNSGLYGEEDAHVITQDDNIGLYRVEDAHVITQDETIGLYGVEDAHVITQDDNSGLYGVEKAHVITQGDNIGLYEVEKAHMQAIYPLNAEFDLLEHSSPNVIVHTKSQMSNTYAQSMFDSEHLLADRRVLFDETLQQLCFTKYKIFHLRLAEVLQIGQESMKRIALQGIEDIPWYFLQNLIALNGTARNTRLAKLIFDMRLSSVHDDDADFIGGTGSSISLHPLDVLCVLLHCTDVFLQQEILSKMSMCQFALPLLLPSIDGLESTFMLWATRDIVKRWRPQSLAESKGCREENLVLITMPTFSFLRMGKCSLSKSRVLNKILSPVQQNHDFFVHQNMEGGNVPRKISDGLVEISWYFPGGRENSDIFPEPVAFTNLRGDLKSNWQQFSFLARVSSALFVVTESINEQDYELLTNINSVNTNYFFIIAPSSQRVSEETQKYLKMLYPVLKISRKNILVMNSSVNEAELVKQLQMIIADLVDNSPLSINLEEMSQVASSIGIHVDENSEDLQKAKRLAREITVNINDVMDYKKKTMRLQGDLWKELAQIEKEICRMKWQGSENSEDYRAKLVRRYSAIRMIQKEHDFPDGMTKFITAITSLPQMEKHFFLKWLKFYLDSFGRHHLSALQTEYKESCHAFSGNLDQLKRLDQRISNSSLGVEHFLRELGQFYEAEYSSANDGIKRETFSRLPGIAADLLLDGFPLELIDGDASNIPLHWVTDILNELDNKTGKKCRMSIITVLGVQSTGKSTLLNTMFGLQFPVASGRCTRGAFMTLIKVKENVQNDVGCGFILVIDTEGLKAPELASLENTFEHDNELATLVVGLSDITIINMAMENTTEMKDILQIVVHAFLRMKEVGKKPNCQFVHQNVSDVTAHEKNMRDRKRIVEQLDEMTKAAARMEENNNVQRFSDIMDYDVKEHSWYIPGLWHGVPPMASVNTGYSENVFELKKHLIEIMKKQNKRRKPQAISDFLKWMKTLWNAVKYEKFIFSFRNSLVAEAYNLLSVKYSELEWNFRKTMHNWLIEAENLIRNQTAEELDTEMCMDLKYSMCCVLHEQEMVMTVSLEKYFENEENNVRLVERYREDFFRSIKVLRNELEVYLGNKCEEVIRIQKGKHVIKQVQEKYLQTIEEKAISLLETCRSAKHKLTDQEIESEFDVMWANTLMGLHMGTLKKRNIGQEMLAQIRKDMRHKAGYVTEKLNEIKCLADYGQNCFIMDKKYFQSRWYDNVPESYHYEYWNKVNVFAISLVDTCHSHASHLAGTLEDYDQTYCQELLNVINNRLNQDDVKGLHLSPLFETDLKLIILSKAAPLFQKSHNRFIQENNPKFFLERLRPQYFSTFKNIYQEKDESQIRAQKFCEICLKPALTEYAYRNLGGRIVEDIITGSDSMRYSSRTFFQFTLLKELLEDKIFSQYVKYTNHYETFVKNWILKYIIEKYKKPGGLDFLRSSIISVITRKIRDVLRDPKVFYNTDVSSCLKMFCEMLKKDLVISQNDLKVIIFKSTASAAQFSADIETFLDDVEKQISAEMKYFSIEAVLSKAALKPQDELFKKVFGCGKLCPFCKVPCEAGATDHKEHFASVHRPQGLGSYRCIKTKVLSHSICTTDVVGNTTFQSSDTDWKPHPYKEYRKIYPDWVIQPDPTIGASDYWKFIFKEFNKEFAEHYIAKPADIAEDWYSISKQQALGSLKGK
eukprot:XP_012809549.1 PREDICTED: interferon-induced very large GTPase 1-like [Xenopus tropicalis]